MLLNELTDAQVAGAFINPDQTQRRKDSGIGTQQLAKQQGEQIAQDRQSKDPLVVRIAALRAQLAQLLIQKQNRDKASGNTPNVSTTGHTSTQP